MGIASSTVSGRAGNNTLAAALTAAGCTGFFRGVFAGVGSIFAAMFSEGCCKNELLGFWDELSGLGLSPFMVVELFFFFEAVAFEILLRGEECVEDGGEYAERSELDFPCRSLSGFGGGVSIAR